MELAGRLCWCCRVIHTLLRQPADADKADSDGWQGSLMHPRAPLSCRTVLWGATLHLSTATTPPSLTVCLSQLGEGFKYPFPAFINPDSSSAPSISESLSLALALILQHAMEALQATRLTQQGAKVCRERSRMITSSAKVPDAPRNKDDC